MDSGRQRLRQAGPCVTGDDDAITAWLESLAGPESAEPEQRLWQSQVVGFVHGALDSLPIAYSDVLEWKYLEGLSVKEIAARLEVGPKAAESQLTRARRAFRDAIRMVGGAMDVLAQPSREHT